MFISSVSASSYNEYLFCPHKYFINYVLGIPYDVGKKAEIGTMFHKVMEYFAEFNKAKAENKLTYEDKIVGCIVLDDLFDSELVSEVIYYVYNYYAAKSKHDYTKSDYKLLTKMVYDTFAYGNGVYDVRKRKILSTEKFFSVEIKKPWAKYRYEIGHKIFEGNLKIRGVIDLIMENDNNIEILDWKTGARKDWNASPPKVKELEDLYNDPQLLIYFYAITLLMPEIDDFMFTIFYVKDGGPFILSFDKSKIGDIENMIRRFFEKVKDDMNPARHISWKCKKLCYYGMNKKEGTEQTICDYYYDMLNEYGLIGTVILDDRLAHIEKVARR